MRREVRAELHQAEEPHPGQRTVFRGLGVRGGPGVGGHAQVRGEDPAVVHGSGMVSEGSAKVPRRLLLRRSPENALELQDTRKGNDTRKRYGLRRFVEVCCDRSVSLVVDDEISRGGFDEVILMTAFLR